MFDLINFTALCKMCACCDGSNTFQTSKKKTGKVVQRSTKHPFGSFHMWTGSLVPGDGVMIGYGKAQSMTSRDGARTTLWNIWLYKGDYCTGPGTLNDDCSLLLFRLNTASHTFFNHPVSVYGYTLPRLHLFLYLDVKVNHITVAMQCEGWTVALALVSDLREFAGNTKTLIPTLFQTPGAKVTE